MSVEVNCATTTYLDESFTFLDCPGSIEFLQDTLNVLPGIDAAVVVCEPEPAKVQMLKPYLKRLDDLNIPHFLFVNKIDKAGGSLRALLTMLQDASDKPLLLRQIPIWEDNVVHRFCRSRAGTCVCLSHTCGKRSDRACGRDQGSREAKRASRCWRSSPITTST